jgi:transcriptional regulator with PAS, ATPase and Fis domain
MVDPLKNLLDQKGFGALFFDGRLRLVEASSTAQHLLSLDPPTSPYALITDIFPELVGIEVQLEQIVAKQESVYRLDHVNRIDKPGQLRYLNLLLMACPEKDRGLLVVEDVTDSALTLQADNQQRYDLYLYRTSIEHRRNQIGRSILGQSAAIEHIIQTVQQLSHIPSATVLLMGETGTGKNLAARMIHESAMAADAPFVEINCAALPEQLIEAELFGYDKGAFTHAVSAKPGLLEAAHGGTLFLDEIGELPINMQAKLLSTIESKAFRRLGSTRQRQVNLRIIAATNRDLRMEIAAKTFREDLFYRLNVVSITLPPLRELGEDILLIGDRFVEMLNIQFNKKVKGFSPAARKALLAHHWPGNVRELSNCIERAMIFINDDQIDIHDLVLMTPAAGAVDGAQQPWTVPSSGIELEEVERSLILSALEQADNNKSKAARLLGLTRHTLRYRMEKHGLE